MHDLALAGIYFFAIALLYSTVGHAGASGYLATMALLSFTPEVMKPTALALNIIVALVTTVRFAMAGHFSWRLFWPFALASVPMAYMGGGLALNTTIYKILVGIALVFAAFILLNSISGLAGYLQKGGAFPEHIAFWSVAVISGGFIGSTLGATKFNSPVLRVLLGVMLVMAGLKMVVI
jgi:uncharacterized membrane protein YfcA